MVNLVIGPSCAGKSFFIQGGYFDLNQFKVLDLLDYEIANSEYPENGKVDARGTVRGYTAIKEDIVKFVKNGDSLIVEHTLFKQFRREDVLSAIRKVSDTEINLYVVVASKEQLIKNCREKAEETGDSPLSINSRIREYTLMEKISMEEGFSNLYIVRDVEGEKASWEVEAVTSCTPSEYYTI